MLKKLLQTFLNKFTIEPVPFIVRSELKYFTNQSRGFISFMSQLNQSNNKLKVILFRMNNSRLIFNSYTYATILLGAISYNIYDNREPLMMFYNKYRTKQTVPQIKIEPKNNEPFLPKIVIKEVLQKNEILDMLAKLIPRIVEKPSIQHNITKQINRVYTMSPIEKKTQELLVQVVKEQLHSDDLYKQLKSVILKVIQSQKEEIHKLIVNLLKIQEMQNLTTAGLTNVFSNPNTKKAMGEAIFNNLSDFLKSDQSKKLVITSLSDYLG